VISPHPGGVFLAPIDRRPPSRAYLKLLEAEAQLGRAIGAGEACVDLGGSPGGWSWVALERGATVVGVDRAPFRADVDANPRFSFVTGDAFKYAPPGRVDWLLCDVIAAPERTIELVENWFSNRWCRNFTVTVKFRGDEDYPLLEQVKRTAGECGAEFILRRLLANKNETTLFGSLPD
jgi:23S rRNA (cytidine2498-2'-O)-methyltransferase